MIDQLGNGLLLGIIISVASVALSLLYGVTRIVNFAHGEIIALGAIVTLFFSGPIDSRVLFLERFSPLGMSFVTSALTGGLLIGFAVFLFFIFNGRLAGVSSIASDSILKSTNRIDNLLFLLGLIIGPILYSLSGNEIESVLTNSLPLIIIGGLLVGVGTKIANGCTSGHGVCGISRFSIRSIVATISFILTGVVTVLIFGV